MNPVDNKENLNESYIETLESGERGEGFIWENILTTQKVLSGSVNG